MNYELASELKSAGFRQYSLFGRNGMYYLNPDMIVYAHGVEDLYTDNGLFVGGDLLVYKPSLSELIEACGDSFYCVIRGRGSLEGVWVASQMTSPEFNMNKTLQGSTPEEAVANLWLALNPKK